MSPAEPGTVDVADRRSFAISKILGISIIIVLLSLAIVPVRQTWTIMVEMAKGNALATLFHEVPRLPGLVPDVNLDGQIKEAGHRSWREEYYPGRGVSADLLWIVIPADEIIRNKLIAQQPDRPNSDAMFAAVAALPLKWSDPGDFYVRDGKVLLVTRDGETAIDLRGERIVFRNGIQYTLPKTATDEEIIQLLTGAVAPPYE